MAAFMFWDMAEPGGASLGTIGLHTGLAEETCRAAGFTGSVCTMDECRRP